MSQGNKKNWRKCKMIVLSKEQIEKMVDPDQMMDQIEEAYRIYGSGEFYSETCRRRSER